MCFLLSGSVGLLASNAAQYGCCKTETSQLILWKWGWKSKDRSATAESPLLVLKYKKEKEKKKNLLICLL